MRDEDKILTGLGCLWVLMMALGLCLWIAAIYVAIHFIGKWW